MPHVSRGERRTPRQHNARDLRVAQIARTPGTLSVRADACRSGCRSDIEVQHTVFQILDEQPRERRLECPSPTALREEREPQANLEDRDARQPYRFGRASIASIASVAELKLRAASSARCGIHSRRRNRALCHRVSALLRGALQGL